MSRVASIDDKALPSHEKEMVEVVRASLDRFEKSGLAPEEFERGPDFE